VAPEGSIVLYNLACFNALLGHQEKALTWLEKAVEAGFYGPEKIASDPDLKSVREEPRYQAARAKAKELAAHHHADDIVINSKKEGEAYKLSMEAWRLYKEEQDYQQCLRLVEQAYEIAPQDSRILYYLACFHALLGHEDRALGFLEKAVDGGFYCPRHISRDPDLESIRGHDRYKAAVAKAREKAAELGVAQAEKKLTGVKRVADRLFNAAGIFDYVASTESTDGYSTRAETVVALVPGAKERPLYPVFGERPALARFDRYLPKETESFSVSNGIDVAELYEFIEDSFHVAGPKGDELLAKWKEIEAKIGIDIKQDLVDWIEGSYISVTLENGQGAVLMVKVKDEDVAREKISALIEFLSTKLGEVIAQNPPLAMLTVHTSPVADERLKGFENLHFAVSPQPVVWGTADGYLVFSSSAEALVLCLETAKGAHPSIRENARVMEEAIVPSGPFASVTLTDERKFGEELATGIGMVSMMTGMMTMAMPDREAQRIVTKIAGMLAKLAPVVRKVDFYKSTATHTTFNGQAWHSRSVTHYFSPAERAGAQTP
jgi:hypothetical protein